MFYNSVYAVDCDCFSQGFSRVVDQVLPSVVHITTEDTTKNMKQENCNEKHISSKDLYINNDLLRDLKRFFDQFEAISEDQRNKSSTDDKREGKFNPRKQQLGTGFIFDPAGYVVTNYHVLENLNTKHKIFVIDSLGEKYESEMIGFNKNFDIAVLKLSSKRKDFPHLKFDVTKKYKIGDWVISIGNQFGIGVSTSVGIISALNRDILQQGIDLIQTDAAMNMGSSGGPLFNIDGEVIGVNVAIIAPANYFGNVGVSFAIPADVVLPIANSLKEGKQKDKGLIGLTMQYITDDIFSFLELPDKYYYDRGVLIVGVAKNSPAFKAGIKTGDVLTRINDTAIKNPLQVGNIVEYSDMNKDLKISLLRKKEGGKLFSSVNFEEMNFKLRPSLSLYNDSKNAQIHSVSKLGIELEYLSDKVRNNRGISDNRSGAVIVNVDNDDSTNKSFNLNFGDVVRAFIIGNGSMTLIQTEKDFFKFIQDVDKLQAGDSVLLFIDRLGENFSLVLNIK
ncbi:PDZ domain-containing protein [Anaplasmataceae bacterium AB001_6]|nr:PDZ domain-containing protein [Anaplasmataceae bacterium AB001_6]